MLPPPRPPFSLSSRPPATRVGSAGSTLSSPGYRGSTHPTRPISCTQCQSRVRASCFPSLCFREWKCAEHKHRPHTRTRLAGLNSSNEAYLMHAMSIAGESLIFLAEVAVSCTHTISCWAQLIQRSIHDVCNVDSRSVLALFQPRKCAVNTNSANTEAPD